MNPCLDGTCLLHLQGWRLSQTRLCLLPASGIIFHKTELFYFLSNQFRINCTVICALVLGYYLVNFYYFQVYLRTIFFFAFLLSFIWFTSCLAETYHTTFDFREGRSHLVSGCHTQYVAGGFALLLVVECTEIPFVRWLFCNIFRMDEI